MQLEYHASAQKNNVYVVGACGFDSIPAEMGILYLERKFNGQLNSVESYLSFKTDKVSFCITILYFLFYKPGLHCCFSK